MILNKRNMKKIMWLLGFTTLLLVGIWRLEVVFDTLFLILGILKPFIVGGCIAFILCQPMKFIEDKIFHKAHQTNRVLKKITRPFSIFFSILFVLGLLFLAVFIVAPEVTKTLTSLFQTIPGFVENARLWVTDFIQENRQIEGYLNGFTLDWNKINNTLLDATSFLADGALSSVTSIISGIVSTVTTFVIGFVFAIYLLASKEKLACQGKKLMYSYLPRKRADRLIMILQLMNKTFANYVSGQCIEALILGGMFFATLTIFRFPYALLIGVLVAFTALIPILGAYIGSAISTFLIFMVDPALALWFIVIFNVLQQIEGNLIYPQVVGGSVGLPSIWVLFAVTVGGSLMGVMGMIIFIPIISVIYSLLRENVQVRLIIRRIPTSKYDKIE